VGEVEKFNVIELPGMTPVNRYTVVDYINFEEGDRLL